MSATLIVALDYGGLPQALALVDRLGDGCGFYKVGSELFSAAGPGSVEALRTRGKRVFLDLKLHDIPNTVAAAARAAARLGASLLTVHATGGTEMMRAAVEGAGDTCGIMAVTVLTSLDDVLLGEAWGRHGVEVRGEVVRLSRLAARAGVHGVVCAGEESAAVREANGEELTILVPGVRFGGGATHDQRRVVTPAGAVAAGASYVVMGRAITADPDPVAAMERARREVAGARPEARRS